LDLLDHLEDGDGNPYEMLSGIRVISEFSVASVRPDIVALKNRIGPIGFCEVKRPSPTSDASPLDNRSILGQAFDYAVELRNSYGIRWPFVLLTTFTEWRVVWLNDPACIYAASATSLDALLDGPGPAALTEERFLFCSRIVNGVGNAEIARFLSTVLLKMAHSPIEDLGANKLWPLFKLSGIKWVTLSTGQEWTYELPVDAQPPFVGLQTLGSGRDGRCWLVLKENKRFVLKILKPFVVEDVGGRHAAAEKAAQEEAGRWSVWNVQAKYLTVLDHAAIAMPFVETFKSLDEARSRRSDIQAALEKLARAGYAHMDLRNNDNSFKYAHFGELSGHIVAIDLSEVKTGLTYEDALSQMDVDGLLRLLE
jgi:hypothetical protein